MVLGDLGADVIKVERPGGGDETRAIPPHRDGVSHYYLSVNRNKRSLAVDLKQPDGRRLMLELASASDVVVENFRPGVADRLGLGYEAIRAVRPDIVYCSVSGYGQDGPWAQRSAFDIALQALSGAMSVTGHPGADPVRLGLPIGDLSAGLFGAIGVLAALNERARTGEGQRVDVAMLDSIVGLLGYLASRYFMTGESPGPVGGGHHSIVPYGVFAVRDGHIVLAGMTDAFWPKLCRALDRPDLAADERYATNTLRLEQRGTLDAIVGEALAKRTVDEWCERLSDCDVPHAPLLSIEQALHHEQVRARGVVREAEHPTLGTIETLGPVIAFPDRDPATVTAAPPLGADTEAVLRDVLGYADERIADLREAGVVGGAPAAEATR
jgi:formyl-CoA transferase/CoA:oxalate CoA-transferase